MDREPSSCTTSITVKQISNLPLNLKRTIQSLSWTFSSNDTITLSQHLFTERRPLPACTQNGKRFYACIDLRVIFQSAHRIKSFFPTRIRLTILKCQKLFIRLVVGTARIFTSAKQNVDCMTGKPNILKGSLVPVMHLLSQTTSRQLVTT